MGNIVRWGILGNAMIARDFFIPAMKGSTVCRVEAIASRTPLPADFLTGCRHYDSYEALLNDPDIDAIYVPVPNALHAQWSIRAMEHGKHVLCEKPLACTAEEARRMIQASRDNGVLLMEAFMHHYGEKFRKMMQIVESGVLGRITSMQGVHGYPLTWASPAREDPALGGGSLYDVGCYVVDAMNAVMTAQGARIEAVGGTSWQKGGVDHNASCWLRYDNGTLGVLQCWFNAQAAQHMLLVGEKGTLMIPGLFETEGGEMILTLGGEAQSISTEGSNCYGLEAEVFSRAILGQCDERMPLEASLRNATVLEQLVRAVSR